MSTKGHPYKEWITTYGSPEYEELPCKQEELLNAVGPAQPYGAEHVASARFRRSSDPGRTPCNDIKPSSLPLVRHGEHTWGHICWPQPMIPRNSLCGA